MTSKLSRARARISGRYALVTALVLAVGIPAVAVGAGEGRSVVAGKRNPSSGDLVRETQIIARNGTYGTRQSNKGAGGGAIYGCRTDTTAEPCIRANNLREGRAFEFETDGNTGGQISVQDESGVPFTTNATGRVENLNADKVDGVEADELAPKTDLLFAAVTADGSTVAGRGATAVAKTGQTTTVTFDRDVAACSFTATAFGTVPQALAVQTAPNEATKVQVTEPSEAPDPEVPTAFHLQVIC